VLLDLHRDNSPDRLTYSVTFPHLYTLLAMASWDDTGTKGKYAIFTRVSERTDVFMPLG
jgi:hypothetical protein